MIKWEFTPQRKENGGLGIRICLQGSVAFFSRPGLTVHRMSCVSHRCAEEMRSTSGRCSLELPVPVVAGHLCPAMIIVQKGPQSRSGVGRWAASVSVTGRTIGGGRDSVGAIMDIKVTGSVVEHTRGGWTKGRGRGQQTYQSTPSGRLRVVTVILGDPYPDSTPITVTD